MTYEPIFAAVPDGGPAIPPKHFSHPEANFKFEVLKGFFLQSGPKPKHATAEELVEKSFGLLDQSSDRWLNLRSSISKLQAEAKEGEQIKVLFCGRHGEGWHNVGCDKHGQKDWEEKWAMLTGDGEITWGPDPFLTPLGESQAVNIGKAWSREQKAGAPIAHDEMKWYTSPFTRAIQTLERSWKHLRPERVEAWEDLREVYGCHQCDLRLNKAEISARHPWIDFEAGFAEEDPCWKVDEREDDEHMQMRMQRAMDRIFSGDTPETYVSLTAHSAILRNLLTVLDHQPYPLSTGEMIPIVVRAVRV